MKDVSGKRANRAGDRLEKFVNDVLDEHQYRLVDRHRFFPARVLRQPIYTTQLVVGKDIYGKDRKIDSIIYHPTLWPECLVIQCKWQASRGSVEEKYPFEVLSISMNEFDTIVVMDGGGYSPGARQWLLNQAGKNRLRHVFNQGEFSRFASQGRI